MNLFISLIVLALGSKSGLNVFIGFEYLEWEILFINNVPYFSLLVQRKVTKEKTLFLRYFALSGKPQQGS